MIRGVIGWNPQSPATVVAATIAVTFVDTLIPHGITRLHSLPDNVPRDTW